MGWRMLGSVGGKGLGEKIMISDAKLRRSKAGDKPISDSSIRGLYFFPSSAAGNGKWVLRFISPETGKRRDMGLGAYPLVTLREARERAFALRQKIEDGTDPIEERRRVEEAERKQCALPDFETAARILHANLLPGFRNSKHGDQWIRTLETYVFPLMGKKLINKITAQDFAACLKPIWLRKAETASRVKQRCDAVMNWCAAQGYIIASPVGVVDKLLPKQPGKRERVEHQPAMPWRDVPVFFAQTLSTGWPSRSKVMLQILILTAVRSGELRQMTWGEIDFQAAVWTIPASRMKAKVMHRIPLASPVLALLRKLKIEAETAGQENRRRPIFDVGNRSGSPRGMENIQSRLVFPSRNGTPISDITLTKFLKDNEVPSDAPDRHATAHGFRSSFRDWASEHGYPRDLAERALAHTIKSAAEAAYHRTDLLDQRRSMMEAWAQFCNGWH